MHAHSSLSWNPLLCSAPMFSLKARKKVCDTAGGFRSFWPCVREVAIYFPLPAFGTIFQFTVCRAAGISLLVQEARIALLPFIHPGVPTHFVVALFEALLGLDLYGPMDGFFAAAWEHLESRGERAALRSVPFCQHLASKTASTSLRLQILASQKAVAPSILPVWYLGKILRWKSNGWVHKGHCYVTMHGHPHSLAQGHRTNSSSPTASGALATSPRKGCEVEATGRDCAASRQQARREPQAVRLDSRLIIHSIILVSHLQNRHSATSTLPAQASQTAEHHGCGVW